ncbi:MAG: S8 family serine peptidase [Thermoguttaceae bacterium]|jgi:subtilisin family serine protease
MKRKPFSFLRQFAVLLAASVCTHAAFGAETIQPLGTSLVSPPSSPTLYSMAGGLKLSAASAGGSVNLLYVQNPAISGAVHSGVLNGQVPLNSPGAPAPPAVAAPSAPSTAITAHSNIYDIAAYDPNTGNITWGNYINDFIGATTFYQTGVLDDRNPANVIGIFGQDTYVAHIDAGHPFAGPNGATTLAGVVVNDPNICYSPTDSNGNPLVVTDPQAHATEVSMAIAGGGSELLSAAGTTTVRAGIAPLTNLCTGAIATSTASDGSFTITAQTFLSTFSHFADATWTRNIAYPIAQGISTTIPVTGPTDVVNASFSITPDTAGTLPETVVVDALAQAHPQTTFVISAGNFGPASNSLGGPASGYNVIAVGAADDVSTPGTTTVASFSGRGPQDFAGNPNGPNPVVAGVRAPVDLVAPGVNLLLATYTGDPTQTDAAIIGSGTSFAAPIVSSGVSLLDSLSYHLAYTVVYASSAQNFANSRDSRVIKAVLMNSATKLPGWNNGQYTSGNTTYTEQALDVSQGAGMLNMTQAMNQYIGGTLDPWGYAGSVLPTGWSLATVATGGHTDYTIDTQLPGNSYLDATLCWFRDRALPGVDPATGDWDPTTSALPVTDLGMAKLDLQIWDANFTTLYAESDTSYNDVQSLHFLLPSDGDYAIRVLFDSQLFGLPDSGGETFGLAWNDSLVTVPEPSTLACLAAAAIGLLAARTRKRRRQRSR